MKLIYQISTLALGFIRTGVSTPVRGLQAPIPAEPEAPAVPTPWIDECMFEGADYPCPLENSFCQDRRPNDFFYKCGCVDGAIPTLPLADGSVELDGVVVLSIDGIPIAFRPVSCDIPVTSTPTPAPVSESLAPVGPTQLVECTRDCVNDGEACIASGVADDEGLFECSCLPGWTKTNGGGCSDIKQCEDSTLNNCGLNAICVELDGGVPGFTCVCPDGFVGGAFTNCVDPNAEETIEVDATISLTISNVNGEMNATEQAGFESLVQDAVGELVPGTAIKSATILSQEIGQTGEGGRSLQVTTNRVTILIIFIVVESNTGEVVGGGVTTLTVVTTLIQEVDIGQIVTFAQRNPDTLTYFAAATILAVEATTPFPTISPAPTPEPAPSPPVDP